MRVYCKSIIRIHPSTVLHHTRAMVAAFSRVKWSVKIPPNLRDYLAIRNHFKQDCCFVCNLFSLFRKESSQIQFRQLSQQKNANSFPSHTTPWKITQQARSNHFRWLFVFGGVAQSDPGCQRFKDRRIHTVFKKTASGCYQEHSALLSSERANKSDLQHDSERSKHRESFYDHIFLQFSWLRNCASS